jgi:hypothetical protein
VFIDETWAKDNMVRLYGRSPRGQRLLDKVPLARWQTTTFVAALRCDGLTAPFVLDGPINGEWFFAYVEQVLCRRSGPATSWCSTGSAPTEAQDPGSHRGLRRQPQLSAEVLARPEPIEMAFSKLKALLRKLPSDPPKPSGTASVSSSTPSPQTNAPTTSKPPDMVRREPIPL